MSIRCCALSSTETLVPGSLTLHALVKKVMLFLLGGNAARIKVDVHITREVACLVNYINTPYVYHP
jgi:hypothetical protein